MNISLVLSGFEKIRKKWVKISHINWIYIPVFYFISSFALAVFFDFEKEIKDVFIFYSWILITRIIFFVFVYYFSFIKHGHRFLKFFLYFSMISTALSLKKSIFEPFQAADMILIPLTIIELIFYVWWVVLSFKLIDVNKTIKGDTNGK